MKARGLPEHTISIGGYADTGCKYAPACLTCHLPECVLIEPRNPNRDDRDERIVAGVMAQKANRQIAAEVGVSYSTVASVIRKRGMLGERTTNHITSNHPAARRAVAARSLWAARIPIRDIAQALAVTPTTVRSYLQDSKYDTGSGG